MIKLQSSHWRLWLNPDKGVQWQAAEARSGTDQWYAVVPDCRDKHGQQHPLATTRAGQDEQEPLAAANFHMLPYSNRLRDGKFEFAGQHYQLNHPERHAIHGPLRRCRWQLQDVTDTSLHCVFDSRQHDPIDWPWPIEAHIHYEVSGERLSSRIRLTNRGSAPMPAGGGWHPYFTRQLLNDNPHIAIPVSGVFPDTHGDCLPTGKAIALPDELDFRQERQLDSTQRIDHCFSGLSGPVSIRWPDASIALTLRASDSCRFLVLYNPDKPHFAIEPVGNANDGINLMARNIDAGVTVLEPGQCLEMQLRVDVSHS